MDHSEYSLKLEELSFVDDDEINFANLIALGEWVENVALSWLWYELSGAIMKPKQLHPNAKVAPNRRPLKPMKDAEAVRKGLMISVVDRQKMLREPSYYHAQLTMLDKEARRYCAAITNLSNAASVFAKNASSFTLHQALHEMMRMALPLLEDAARDVTGVPGYFSAWRSKSDDPFEVFKGAEQIIYGTFSGLTHVDRAPYTPVAVLRTAIELRLRRAFGVSSFLDPNKSEELIPIDLSKLFDVIQIHQKEIQFSVDMHDVWKIYRWSNFYLHGGNRDFPWVPGFLLQYLRPLFVGPPAKADGSWSIYGGIKMRRETWRSVRSDLQVKAKKLTITRRLANAWRELCPSMQRQLMLPVIDEKTARCEFLD